MIAAVAPRTLAQVWGTAMESSTRRAHAWTAARAACLAVLVLLVAACDSGSSGRGGADGTGIGAAAADPTQAKTTGMAR